MSLVLPTLLCLALVLGQSTQAQKGALPQPNITAQPGFIVLSNEPVTIQCQGLTEAEAYKIFKEGGPEPREAETSTLHIKEMKPDQTGLYHCSYKSGKLWSPCSVPLTLVMTGTYAKPSLSSMSDTVVASGDEVMWKCFSKLKFDRFILIKEDGFHTIQNESSTCQDNQCQAIFHRGPVTPTQAGTYRCYGAFNCYPYVWSQPSNPLELEVKELPDGSTRPTDPRPTQERPDGSTRLRDSGPTQGPSQNLPLLIGVPVAILLFLLLVLLFLCIRHRKAKNKATKTGRQAQAAESRNRQAPETRDPQDVTYLQVAFNGPNQGTFSTLRQTHTNEYATIVPK
ncbi:leukocyte immunoglobulin-like receptor subfamily A member 5 [Phyllostomus hastatus]|uniref:leukocyte immunoglobulin-like receptor subfamily A member 5 n=1 Tax=Phyllostomus hastatus TaxID=9423 RepID=UPI001E683792|nr:leukocyte immunoglobulin-like receptor subfamily A member 5 [Phyllostomus hastatus]